MCAFSTVEASNKYALNQSDIESQAFLPQQRESRTERESRLELDKFNKEVETIRTLCCCCLTGYGYNQRRSKNFYDGSTQYYDKHYTICCVTIKR